MADKHFYEVIVGNVGKTWEGWAKAKLDVPVEKIGGSTGKLPLDTIAGV